MEMVRSSCGLKRLQLTLNLGTTSQLRSVITQLGCEKAFVVTGRSLYEKTPIIKSVEKQLGDMHGGTYYKIGQHA